jgi:two-component system heavy metal sensor histidine kinase CusS
MQSLMRWFLPRTLRARLTILFALTTSVLLSVNGIFLYGALEKNIEANAAQDIFATLTTARERLETLPSIESVAKKGPAWFDPFHAHESIDMAIFAEDGRALVSTTGFRLEASHNQLTAPRDQLGGTLRYVSAVAPIESKRAAVRVVIQYDTRKQNVLLRNYAFNVLLVTLLGTLVSAVSAYTIAKFGLRPLRMLAARADAVSWSKLLQPLPDANLAGEMLALNRAFNRMLARLDESFMRLSRFSSDLAHDMRTPLTNLLAESQVALSRPRNAEEYRAVIESGVEETRRLARMINDMLFLARSENSAQHSSHQKVDARLEAERVASYYETLAADNGVQLRVEGEGCFNGNPLLVQRALSNLLSNALAQAPSGSEVLLLCIEHDTVCEVSVIDTGPGIADEHLPHIFDRFYRVDPARAQSASGTGLGLAIVKSIMEEHEGECSVTSQGSVRTTFVLTFPKLASSAPQ